MAINVPFLEKAYFYFDEPVPYTIHDKTILIKPISLKDSEIFLSSVGLLTVDKNSLPSVEIIKMSYLKFIVQILFQENPENIQRLVNILKLCLDINDPVISPDYELISREKEIVINSKAFEEIKRIILFQNIPNYDDSYIDPEVKQSMAELDELKNRNIEIPSLERKIAIITAHCGLSKKEQLQMTYRSHSMLFNEVYTETEYMTTKPIAWYTGQADKVDNWIYKQRKGKFDDYFVSTQQFSKSMGGDGNIKSVTTSDGDLYNSQLNSFNK